MGGAICSSQVARTKRLLKALTNGLVAQIAWQGPARPAKPAGAVANVGAGAMVVLLFWAGQDLALRSSHRRGRAATAGGSG